MVANEPINIDVPPPSYDEIIRYRKQSTVQQQPCDVKEDQGKDIQKQDNNVKGTGNEFKDHKVVIGDSKIPKDHFFFVILTVLFLGLVHLLPYSFFITANEYWMYKFRNTTLNYTDANDRTYLQVNFSALTNTITTIASVICNFVLTFVAHNVKAKTRIMVTLVLHSVIFCLLVVFVNINTDSWQEGFFIFTAAAMVIVMCSISFGAAGQYGLITKLPPMYMKAYLLGGGMSSLSNASMRLLSVAVSSSPIVSANIYFGTGTFLLVTSTTATFYASNTSFFRHYTSKVDEEFKEKKIRTANEFREVLKCIWPMLLFNFFLLAIPSTSVGNLVVSEYHEDQSNVWANQYFVTVCTYLIPAITNTIGRAIYNKLDWNWSMPAMFLLVTVYQIVNTTTVYLSNALPRHHLPILLKHDWEYALVMALHGLVMGFMVSMSTIRTLRMAPRGKTELTMILLYFFTSVVTAACSPLGILSLKII